MTQSQTAILIGQTHSPSQKAEHRFKRVDQKHAHFCALRMHTAGWPALKRQSNTFFVHTLPYLLKCSYKMENCQHVDELEEIQHTRGQKWTCSLFLWLDAHTHHHVTRFWTVAIHRTKNYPKDT